MADITVTIVDMSTTHITVMAMPLATNKISFLQQLQYCTSQVATSAEEQSSSLHMAAIACQFPSLPSMDSCLSSTIVVGSSSSFATSSSAIASIVASFAVESTVGLFHKRLPS